ncbi:MAG: hypothetical protein ACI8VE_001266 [Natrialbaceae archaeon]|jgi:hypothetical protein
MRQIVLIAIGALGLVSPKRLLNLNARLNLIGYENTDQVEPKRWLIWATRVMALLPLAVGLLDPFESEE